MADDGGEERKSFKVEDRRRFSETGDPRRQDSETDAEPPAAPTAPPTEAPQSDAEEEPITFAAFLLSLITQTLIHLGEVANPMDESIHADLGQARQLIDILTILRDKTRGNLDSAEEGLLNNALYDLQMRFVERSRNSP